MPSEINLGDVQNDALQSLEAKIATDSNGDFVIEDSNENVVARYDEANSTWVLTSLSTDDLLAELITISGVSGQTDYHRAEDGSNKSVHSVSLDLTVTNTATTIYSRPDGVANSGEIIMVHGRDGGNNFFDVIITAREVFSLVDSVDRGSLPGRSYSKDDTNLDLALDQDEQFSVALQAIHLEAN